jgi:hypothetical protein
VPALTALRYDTNSMCSAACRGATEPPSSTPYPSSPSASACDRVRSSQSVPNAPLNEASAARPAAEVVVGARLVEERQHVVRVDEGRHDRARGAHGEGRRRGLGCLGRLPLRGAACCRAAASAAAAPAPPSAPPRPSSASAPRRGALAAAAAAPPSPISASGPSRTIGSAAPPPPDAGGTPTSIGVVRGPGCGSRD